MSTTYNTRPGDTFSGIALTVYGDDSEAYRIKQANPGVIEPLPVGAVLAVPPLPGRPPDRRANVDAVGPNEVSVSVDGERFRFWESIRVTRTIDAMDTIQLSAPFEPDRPEFRKTFRPFSFADLQVNVGRDPLFTGVMVDVSPDTTPDGRVVMASGYSLP